MIVDPSHANRNRTGFECQFITKAALTGLHAAGDNRTVPSNGKRPVDGQTKRSGQVALDSVPRLCAERRIWPRDGVPSYCCLFDLPGGKFTNKKAKRVLGWTPEDSLLHLWRARE